MSDDSTFAGFPAGCRRFLRELETHNTKQWFEAHRAEYEECLLDPARAFVVALGKRLKKIAPGVHADPRVNKSLFRINRDTRFSADKSPYKTNLGVWFWDGAGKRMECPGFYFHLDARRLMLGIGMYQFSKPALERYRHAVVDGKRGPALGRAVKTVTGCGLTLGGEHYKRVPRGFDPEHKNAAYLRHNGLHAMREDKAPTELRSAALVDYCMGAYTDGLPLHRWLLPLAGAS